MTELRARDRVIEAKPYRNKHGPRARKVRCAICHADGYPGGTWELVHRMKGIHKPCPTCGKKYLKHRLKQHQRRHLPLPIL